VHDMICLFVYLFVCLREMTRSLVQLDIFVCATCLIVTCNMTHGTYRSGAIESISLHSLSRVT